MNQDELYDRQAEFSLPHQEQHTALRQRDDYVLAQITKWRHVNSRVCIAELSIGDGSLTQRILESVPSVMLTGADISANRIELTRMRLKNATPQLADCAEFVKCNFDSEFEALPSEGFEFVIALDVMEHVVDVFGFINNCHRIMQSGAFLFVRVPNVAYIRHRMSLLTGSIPVTASWFGKAQDLSMWREVHGWDGGHLHNFNLPLLRKMFFETGFVEIGCADPGAHFSRIRSIWPEALFANPLFVLQKR